MENGKKVNAVIILMLAVILIFTVVQNSRVRLLEERLNTLENNVTNNFRMELSNVRNYIDNALENSQSVVDTYYIGYEGIDIEQKTVNVIMNFKLKETMGNTKIQVSASNVEINEVLGNFDAETSNGLDYVARFPLSYLYDYAFDIYEIGENGYAKKLNISNSIALYIKNEMDSRIHLASSGYMQGQDEISFNFEIFNNTFGEEGFQMEKVELVISSDGEELYRKDITYDSVTNREDIDRYNMQVASGEIEPTDDIQYNLNKAPIDMEGVESGYYSIDLIPSEILVDKQAEKNFLDCDFSVEVTFKNGEKIMLGGS